MKVRDILVESTPSLVKSSDFTVERIDDNTLKVRVAVTSGPLMSAMKSLALSTNKSFDIYDEDEDGGAWEKYAEQASKFSKIAKAFTVSGRALSGPGLFDKFKANSCLFKFNETGDHQEKALRRIIDKAVDLTNEEIKGKAERTASAPERKKAAAKAQSADQKSRTDALAALYGKETIGRVKIEWIGGDDGYQYNVIVDGRSIMNGLTKSSAEHERKLVWQQLSKKAGLGTFGNKKASKLKQES